MSDTLNAVIAFVGFLILFSMLVTSVQDGLKNLFKLKAGVWERFFINLYEREVLSASGIKGNTEIQNSKPKDEVATLSQAKVPTTRFWTRVKSGEFVGEFDKRLTRLRDIIVDANELLTSLKETLNEIITAEIKSPEDRKQIIQNVTKMVGSLKKLTGLNLTSLLNIYDQFVGKNIGKFFELLEKFEKNCPELQQDLAEKIDLKIDEIKDQSKDLLDTINKYEEYLSKYATNIEKKADAWLVQLNQEYKRNMLKWTLVIGTVFVLAFNADSFKIFRYLMYDTTAQNAIIQKATETTLVTQHANAENLNKARQAIDDAEIQTARDIILSLLESMQKDFNTLEVEKKGKYSNDLKEIKDIKDMIEPKTNEALDIVKPKYDDVVRLYVELQKEYADYQLKVLTALDLPLGWVDDWNLFRAFRDPGRSFLFIIKKIGGLVLTCFLITFGAPFWKDVLNALVGIKKTVLKKQ